MRRIDELQMTYPFAGSRMLRALLGREGVKVGRLHVATLMKKMGIAAIYRLPNRGHARLRRRPPDSFFSVPLP